MNTFLHIASFIAYAPVGFLAGVSTVRTGVRGWRVIAILFAAILPIVLFGAPGVFRPGTLRPAPQHQAELTRDGFIAKILAPGTHAIVDADTVQSKLWTFPGNGPPDSVYDRIIEATEGAQPKP